MQVILHLELRLFFQVTCIFDAASRPGYMNKNMHDDIRSGCMMLFPPLFEL